MKPHIRKVRGIWECRMRLCLNLRGFRFMARPISYEHPEMGHGYTVREAYEDWKAQMKAQRA